MISIKTEINATALLRYEENLERLSNVVHHTAFAIERDVTMSLTLSSGKWIEYPRGQSGSHWSSPPGEAPNLDSGILAGSTIVDSKGRYRADIVNDTDYALALELGTSRMAARPFMVPAVIRNANDFHLACRAIIQGRRM